MAIKITPESKDIVKKLAATGVRHEDIAKYMGMTRPTLYKYYRDELDRSALTANMVVAGKLFEQCQEGNTTAIIFWLKTRAKWRETDEDKDDKDPPPLAINFSVSPDIGDTVITRGEKRDE